MTDRKEKCRKCNTELKTAPGIGEYCPNEKCEVIDNVGSKEVSVEELAELIWKIEGFNKNEVSPGYVNWVQELAQAILDKYEVKEKDNK
uniref:Uncharacterized protein n=1 Tax=viral metagenome TaxID=1070528 RepID=A0A6M3KQ34_9ZZZZ